MKCRNCDTECNNFFSDERKFCSTCHCSYLDHIDFDSFNETCLDMVNQICIKTKSTERNIEDSTKLAKTFGTVWLPLGIQPSEVDRFLKYFPTHTDIRRAMFMKSEQRCTEILLQLPLQDRSIDYVKFLTDDASKIRAETFFDQRSKENCDVARIDHLDRSEGNSCSECLDSMGFGEVCVMLPKNRKLSTEVWHPHCFKCITCKHLLVDYLFCWDLKSDSGPYCLRHFDDKYNDRCVTCDEMIFDETYPRVLNEPYHRDHFRCSSCTAIIMETQFVLESDMSMANKSWKCVNCLKETNDTYCAICNEIIEVTEMSVTMDGLMTHDSCVKCRVCQEKISLSCPFTYVRERNFLFCTNCNSKRNSGLCVHCKEEIIPYGNDSVSHGLYSWHNYCLKCIKCQQQVSNNQEFIFVSEPNNLSRAAKLTGEPQLAVCKNCFKDNHNDVCGLCNERIDDAAIKFNSKLFHRMCLRCHHCKDELNPSMFTTKEDLIYCLRCFGQLFCKTCCCCAEPISGYEATENMISFENRNWHETCFFCTLCEKSLMDSGFLFDNEKIICIECGVK